MLPLCHHVGAVPDALPEGPLLYPPAIRHRIGEFALHYGFGTVAGKCRPAPGLHSRLLSGGSTPRCLCLSWLVGLRHSVTLAGTKRILEIVPLFLGEELINYKISELTGRAVASGGIAGAVGAGKSIQSQEGTKE